MSSLSEQEPGFVSLITMVESVWVLQRAYQAPNEVIVRFIDGLLNAREIRVQAPDIVRRAARLLESGSGGFSDAMIALLGAEAGCDDTVTLIGSEQVAGDATTGIARCHMAVLIAAGASVGLGCLSRLSSERCGPPNDSARDATSG